MLTLSIPINHNSPFKSTLWELHFPHPWSAASIEHRGAVLPVQLNSIQFYLYSTFHTEQIWTSTVVMMPNDAKRVIMSQ